MDHWVPPGTPTPPPSVLCSVLYPPIPKMMIPLLFVFDVNGVLAQRVFDPQNSHPEGGEWHRSGKYAIRLRPGMDTFFRKFKQLQMVLAQCKIEMDWVVYTSMEEHNAAHVLSVLEKEVDVVPLAVLDRSSCPDRAVKKEAHDRCKRISIVLANERVQAYFGDSIGIENVIVIDDTPEKYETEEERKRLVQLPSDMDAYQMDTLLHERLVFQYLINHLRVPNDGPFRRTRSGRSAQSSEEYDEMYNQVIDLTASERKKRHLQLQLRKLL